MLKIIALSTSLALSAGIPMTAHAQTTWDMPTPYPDGNFHTENSKAFAKEVADATDGSLQITVHPNQSLIKHAETKNSVRRGTVPIGEILLSRLGNEHPIYGLDSVPFLATSYEDARRLYETQRPVLEELLAEEGIKLLFSVPWPPQGLYMKKKIESVDGLQGVKFRAYNKLTERFAQLAGAIPTQVEASDISTAFATGRIDAMLTSPSTGVDSAAWDFISHYHDVQAWLPRNIVFVNQAAFDALSDEEKTAVLKAAEEAERRGWEMSQEETTTATQTLADHGITVVPPSEELMQGLTEIGEKMTGEWVQSAGEKGKAVLEAYRQD